MDINIIDSTNTKDNDKIPEMESEETESIQESDSELP